MPDAVCPAAYLITPYVMTPAGELCEAGGTVCFDLALALEMAESDGAAMAGAYVFALHSTGELASPKPIATFGLFSDETIKDRAVETGGAPALRLL